jgi:hypothetical protein
MFEDVLRESPFLEDLIDKLHPEIKAEGMSETILLVLEDRFGSLSEDMVKALEHADQDTLRGIAAHASKESLEQIRARLGLK